MSESSKAKERLGAEMVISITRGAYSLELIICLFCSFTNKPNKLLIESK